MPSVPAATTAFFCQLFGHEWVPRLQLGLECTRCALFASDDGRVWPSRRAYEEDVVRSLPALREAFVRGRIGEHVFPLTPAAVLEGVRAWFAARGLEADASSDEAILRSKRRDEEDAQVHLVARVTGVEGEGTRLRVHKHTLRPGFITRFDAERAIEVELALAQELDASAVQDFRLEAEAAFQPPPGWEGPEVPKR